MKKSVHQHAPTLAAILLIAQSAFSNTYTVTNTADIGAGSLRQAITDANANAGADIIQFNIAGGGPWSIALGSALPNLTGPTTIDGTTQPGFVSGTQSTYVKVGTAFTGTIFSASNVTGITIKGLDLSHSSPRNGAGIGLGTCSQTFILDNFIRNRRTGISINGGQDHTVQNNDLLASGENTNETCIYLGNITPGSIPSGIAMNGNKFGGNANMGFRFDNMNNLVIGDASVSGANIVIEDNSGFTAMGLAGQFMLWFNNCNNITIDNVDLSWLGGGISNSHGVIFSNAVTNSTFTVKNCSIKNRYGGIQIGNGKDVTIQNNDLRGSGHENSYAVNLSNITEANVNGGILMSGNTWGRNTGVAESNGGLRLSNTNNLIIGDENTGVHIKIEDNSGFNTIAGNNAERNPMYLENVSNITVDNVDASWSLGGVVASMGIRIQNTGSNGSITIKNCKVQNRYYGMYCSDGKDYTITGNDLRGSGHENLYALYLLNIAEGMIPGGVSVSGNLWGRNTGVAESNGGLYIADMSNLVIGDATTGVHIKIEDNSGFNTIAGNEGSYRGALLLDRVSNITVDNVDASWSLGGITNSFGIFVQNESTIYSGQTTSHRNVTIKNCDFRNRGIGIRIRGGKDYTVTNNDLRGCGEHGHHALQLINIQAGTLTGGILAHTNKFGTGASAINGGIYIQQMNDLTIGDAATGGNIKIEDNSGLNQIVGNDVNSRGALYLNTVSNVTVNSVDCSYATGGQAGNSWGIRVSNTASNSNISILNCLAGNRGRGIWVDNGRDYTITGNNMVGSGNGNPAFELSNIIPGSLTGGILASGNTFGTPSFKRGVVIQNMRNLLIGDENVAGANFVLEDACGLNLCQGDGYNQNHGALFLGGVDNVTVDNVDCSKSTAGQGNSYAIYVANGANNQNVTIKNCKADNRQRGIYCTGGKDYTVQNNTITNSGSDGEACALDFRNVTAGTLTGGVLVSGNTFGNVPISANTSRAGVRFDNMRDLYIGDATTGGNVKLEDGSGLTEVGFDLNSAYVVLNLNNISNSTLDNLNLSYTGTNQVGNAIRLSNGASQGTVTIKDCTINKRRLGIYVGGGRDYTITGNNLTGTGQNSSNDINNGGPAVWLNGLVKGTLDGGIAMSGNTFGGANANGALRIDDMRGFTIGDAVSDDIRFEDGTSGLTDVGNNGSSNDFVLFLRQIADVTVNSVDLTRSGGSQFGGGIRVENGNGNKTVSLTNNSVGNRRTGIFIFGGSDYTVTGNTLTGSGLNDVEPALYFNGITAGSLPGGLSVSGNTFGGTNANTAVRFESLKDIVIGDASVVGRNVTLEDGSSGLSTVGNNATSNESVLFFSNLTNSSINNVDLTRTGGTQLGRGIYVANGLAAYPFSITNCAVGSRRTGIYINGGRNYTVQNNTLTGSGNNSGEPALYLNSLTANSNLLINGNTFGGTNFNTGIRVENTSDLLISDGTVSGTHIGVTTANGLGNATGYALYLANLTRTKVQNMDLSFPTTTRTGTGIQVTTNGGTTAQVEMKSLIVKNRVDGINIASGASHSVKCSDLSDNSDGLEIASSVTNFICEQNSFVGNIGFAINSAATITAENNYFGGGAPGGGANGVTGSVDATPFLTSAPANCPTTLAAFLELKGNQNLILNGSTTPGTVNYTDFGSVKTSTPITRTFTINNTGGVALNVTSISFTGGNAGDFSATALTPASPVPAGGSATFTITFTPGATGLRSTTLSIVNDDPNNNPFTAALQGTGKNVLVVTKTDDTNDGVCDADCSLREAITVANSNSDADVIEFNIGGGGTQTITHTTAFPNITQPLTIDGSSQPGFAGTPLITVNSNSSLTTFTATSVTGLTIKYMDLSRPIANYDGSGIIVSSCNEVFILNNIIKNRFIGIQSNGGRDHTIQNNDLRQTGIDANSPAIYLNGLTARDVPGGIKMSGNLFGDATGNNRSRFGVRINTMSNLLIGDASVANAHITIEDGSGMASTGTGENYCLLLNNVSNTTVDNLDLTATTYGYQGWGLVVSNTADYGNVTVKNCKINTRYSGIYCASGRDYTIQNNDLQKTGLDVNHPSLWVQNITPGTLPTGILASGNTFGDASGNNQSRFGIRISNMSNLVIGDASVSGAHITIEDGSGMASTGTGDNYCLYLDNVSNTTVDNLDLTATTYGYQGWGVVVQNSASNSHVTIKNCKMNNRYSGIYCIGGKDYTITGNDLKNAGNDNTRAALYLSGIRPGTLPAGVVASGNLFGTGTSRTALRVSDMDGLLIGDAGVVGAHIVMEDASGANSMSTDGDNAVIYLNAVSNLTVNDVDISRSASGRTGVGIWVENSGSTVYRNLSILNCKMQQRDMGLYISGGKDVTVTNNDMRYSGSYQDRPALWLGNIQSISLPGGVSLSGNKFGGTFNGATSQSGIQFANMRDLVMADAAAPGVNIVLEDNSGLNDVYGDEVSIRGVLYLNNVRNAQLTSIDLSKMTAGQGTSFALKVNAGINVSVFNGKGSNRYHGYYFEGGRDITVTGNDLTGSGNQRDYPALRFSNVQPGSINTTNGITASGNLFGGANVRTGLRIDNAKNLLIGDASVIGAHIVLEDNSGLNNITQGDGNSEHPAIFLNTVSDITVDNVDASRPSGQDAGGIWVNNSITNSNITIKNCNFNRHRRAIYCTGGRDYTIQNNTLLNSGGANDQPAIYLQNIQQGSLTGGILMSGNTFGGTSSFGGIRFENMRDLSIGDASTGGNVKIEDNSGLNNMGGNSGGNSAYYVLHFVNVNNATVDNVDLSRPVGATPAQDLTGIRIDNGASYGPITIKDCDISRHRVGISAQGGKDYTVTGNDLRGCGGSSDDPALWFNSITQQDGTVPMGILANTNVFGTVNSVVSNCALRLDNLCGIRISDGTVPNSHIKIAAASGIKEVTGTGGTYPSVITLLNTSGMAVEKMDLEFTGTQTGAGIRFQNSNASQYSFSIKDNILKNRRMGVYVINGADYTITGNNFSMTGAADDEPAIRMEHVAEGTLYGGVSMSSNTFGGTGAAFGLKFVNMSNLKISDGSLSGTNVNLGAPSANGLYNVTTGNVLHLSGICNATVGMLDLSRAGLTRQGTGLRMNAGLGNTIQKVLVGNRDKGIEIAGGSNSQNFNCNTLFDNNFGIDVVLGTLTSTAFANNIMDCNGTGLRSTSTSTVAASNNYWGTANGSTTSGGSGDTYSGTVTATPFLATAPACAQTPPDLETKGNSVEIVDGDITPSFSDYTQYCAVTGQTQTRMYTLKNTGNGIMNLTGATPVTLSPASGTPFSITTQPSDVELLPGETTTFSIQFAPVALGTSNVTLNIASKDCRENPYNFALKGQGCVDIQGTISGTQAICAGLSANLTVNISAGLAPFVVTLSDGSAFTVNNIGDNTVTVNPTATTTYTISMITDANGCCSTNTGSATVTVNPLPTPNITVSESSGLTNHDGIICQGATAVLDGGAYAAWDWSDMTHLQTISITAAGTYTVTVTDVNGCKGTDTQAIVVNSNPTPTITETDNSGTANDNILCAGGTATLDAGVYNGYTWSPSGNTQTIMVSAAGSYTVTVTDGNGCTGSDDHAIAVNALPAATLSGALLVCPGTTSALLDLNITAGVAPFTVVLSDASSHNVAAAGASQLTVTVTGPATNSFTITSITGAGGCAGSASGTATVDFGSAGEIEVSGNGTPITDGDNTPDPADHTDFGLVAVGNNFTRTFTITNSHPTLPLNISGVTITGSTDFTLMTAPASSVAANGGTTTFVVKFAPTALGLASATVVLNSGDCDEQPYNFDVQGKGATPAAALNFDGIDDYITTANNTTLDLSTQTVELWAKPSGSGDNDLLVGKRNYNGTNNSDIRWSIHFQNGNQGLYFYSPAGQAVWAYTFTPNQWYHIAMVTDATSTKLYIDGTFISSKATTINSPTNLPVIFGASGPNFEVFPGSLDEVRIWNTARTCDQINQLRNCELTGSESGLMAYYKFNQGFAAEDNTTPPVNTLTDATANANNGTLTGFALTGATSNWVTPGGVITGTSCPAVTVSEADVQGGSPLVSILDGDATPSTTDGTDFGNVAVNGSRARTFTIFNPGNDALTINSITSSNPKFTIGTLTPASPIAGPSGSATFTVTFNPTALGVQNATITINSTDCDEAAYDFVVTGTGATPGAALTLDGSDDYVNLGTSAFEFVGSYTIETWVNATFGSSGNFSQAGRIMDKGVAGGEGPDLDLFGGIRFISANGGSGQYFITAPTQVPANTWSHIAVAIDVANLVAKIYYNGALVKTQTLPGDVAANPTYNLLLGATDGAGSATNFFNGKLDEFRVWNRALCQNEIQAQMNCELAGSESGLMIYYNFNQGIAGDNNSGLNTVNDAATGSGHGGTNNGTLTNFTLSGSNSNWTAPGGVTSGVSCLAFVAPEADVRGGSPLTTIADGDITPSTTDSTDFGLVAVNGSLARTYTLFNTGNAALTVSSITSDNAKFVVSGAPTSVAAGSSASFTVTFSPTATATQTATITINNDDCDEAVYDFAVTGKGATPAAALNFDGTDDFVSVPDAGSLDLGSSLTLEAWVKPESFSVYNMIIDKRDLADVNANYGLTLTNGKPMFYFWNGGNVSFHIATNAITLNAFTHLAATYDGAMVRIFVNGTQVYAQAETDVPPSNNQPLSIGRNQVTLQYFDGDIDEVRIWNTVRNCDEIGQRYNCEMSVPQPGLVAYYKFNQGFAAEDNTTPPVNTLTDATANANNGTLTGFTLTGTTSNWVTPGGVTTGTSCPAVTAPEANVQGGLPLATIADGDNTPSTTDHTDFGFVAVNGNLARTFTIFNTGNAALTIPSITSDNVKFAVSGAPTSVAAGSSASFTVTFNPTALGVQNATITINSNDCDEAVYDFAVTGKGATPAAALHFDGVNDDVIIPHASNITFNTNEDFTVSLYVKIPSTNQPNTAAIDNSILEKTGGSGAGYPYVIRYYNHTSGAGTNGKVYAARWNGSVATVVTSSGALNDNTWHHVAFVKSGATLYLYIDGVLNSTAADLTSGSTFNTGPLSIGSRTSLSNWFNGSVDNLRIWNTARSCEEIRQLRNCELMGSEGGLVAYYKFNQGFANEDNSTVTTLADAATTLGGANDGTLSGFTLSGTASNWVTPGGVTTNTSCPAMITYPEADLLGHDNTPLAAGTTSTSVAQGTNFGSVNFGSSSAAKTFTIQNNGTAVLSVISIVSSDPQFAISALSPVSPVPAGMSAAFTVTFTPTATGAQNATITINNNECDEAVYDFAVTGTGVCIPPSFSACPTGPVTATTVTGTCAALVNYTVTETGNPAPTVTYAFTGATTGSSTGTGSGSSFNKGSTIVTVTATSTCNPAATCSFTVTVTDDEKPQITCAAPVTINTTAAQCTGTTTLTAPTATDNCSGAFSNALHFDGTNDYISAGNVTQLSGATQLTLESWIYPTNGSTGMVMGKGPATSANAINIERNGQTLYFRVCGAADSYGFVNNVLPTNTWTHIACVYDGTLTGNANRLKIYVNGVLQTLSFAGVSIPASAPSSTAPLTVGAFNSSTIPLCASLDEVRIWSTARTQAEIQANMNSEISAQSGLAVLYHFNQGIAYANNAAVTTATDASGNGYTGTLNGFGLNGATSNWIAFSPTLSNNAPTTFPKGITTVTWTARDDSGNTETCQQTVTVIDNQAPTLANPGNQALNTITATCAANYTIADPVSDNCTGATWGYTLSGATTGSASGIADGTGSSVLSFNKGVTTVVLSATDGTNTATTVSFTVTVNDLEKPQITCADPVNINTTAGLCTGTTTLTVPTVTDNCPFGGNGLNFDGSNDQVATAAYSGTALTGDLTMECWFKGTSMNGRALIGRGFQQEFDLALWSNQLSYYHGNGSTYTEVNFNYVFTDNTWYHVAVVRNAIAQTVSLYVNGVFQQTLTYGTPLPVAQTAAFRIGHRAAGQFFSGSMDEVRVWTVARTPAQIAGNWNKELAAQPDLFALYHLNEGIANADNTGATTAADASGNAKDGTLTNFALSGTSSNWGIGAFGGVTNNAPATYPKGSTTVTWTATDASGNTETCQQTVTVTDNEKPTISGCPSNIVLKTSDDGGADCDMEVTYTAPTFADNCDGTGTATYASGPMSGTFLNVSGSPYTVVYTKTDAAGNTVLTNCSFTVTVQDDTKPTLANCPSNIVLKTSDDGGADCDVEVTYTAPTFADNCDGTGTATLQSGPASGTLLNVSGSPYTVVYTKTDAAGNTVLTNCAFTVTVQDDTKPTITCPSGSPFTRNADNGECNYTVQGTEFDPTAFGDNCIGASISNDFNSMATLDGADLPKGSNTITWTVTDGANLSTTCAIVVHVLYPEINVQGNATDITDGDAVPDPGDHTDFGSTTSTPITRTFTIQSKGQLPLTLAAGSITITGLHAALFTVGNISLPASVNGPSGSVTFDVTYTPVGVGTHTATVNIVSNDCDEATYDFVIQSTRNCSPPSFTACPTSPVTVNTDAGQCTAVVNYMVTADGTPDPDLTYLFSGVTTGSDNGTGSGETFNKGNTTVTVTATNPCGTPTCVFTVTVTDNQQPTLSCPSSNTLMPLSGNCTYTLSGTAYDPTGLSDNCGVAGVVNDYNSMASLNGAVLLVGANLIKWTVTDVNGLINTCQFTLTVTACLEISGTIFWKGDGVAGVNNANVALSGEATHTDATDTNGDFDLVANTGDDFTITPSKNTGMLNGVTAADATVIQRHLTGNELITDFYRLIAADCNRSNNISTVDAALIRQALLGNPLSQNILNAAGHWRFVRTDYVPVLAGPYTLDNHTLYSKRTLTGVSGNVPGQDFYGVKTGDVFEESNPGVDVADPSLKPDPDAKPLVWRVRDRLLKTGETIEFDFSVANFTDIAAYQYGMRFDPAVLQYQQASGTSTLVPLDEASHFGTWQVAKGELRTLWSVSEGKTLPGVQPMYRLRFKVLQGGKKLSEVLGLDPAILAALAYTSQLAQREVQLVFTDYVQPGLNLPDILASDYFDLLQNRPNPFSERTTIGFILPLACDAQLRVLDISGRELWRTDKSYPAGYHEETVRLDELNTTGMLFYELTTPQGTQTRKMLAVRL